MKGKLKRAERPTDDERAMIFCCHGLVYSITEKVLGADVKFVDGILDRLRQIDGVKVVEVCGGVGNLIFPTLRLPDVTSVLVPLDSARALGALVATAGVRIQRNPLDNDVFREGGTPNSGRPTVDSPPADRPPRRTDFPRPLPPEANYGYRDCSHPR